jgi:type 1 glutamine amidotransferase
MSKKALIVWGGWDGHEPEPVAKLFAETLGKEGFEVEVSNTLDSFRDIEKLKQLNLIIPVWTMGQISGEQAGPLIQAVESGVGLAGCHGGMCDSFRENTDYQFMTGGQWVAHPGNDGVEYTVKIVNHEHEITKGMKDFQVKSEQYYLHVDPSNKVLATTPMPVADGPHVPNGPFEMPVVWVRWHGKGKVFYSSLGHNAVTAAMPEALELCRRGFLWAAK